MLSLARTNLTAPLRRLVASSSVSARCNSTRTISSMHENDPEVLEREKARNLGRKNKDNVHEHAPGWNELLASASEANVKADKAQGDPETLQSTTVEYLRTKRRETDGESSTTAHYSRDEVSGPLRNADTKDKVIVTHGNVIADTSGPDVVAKAIEESKFRATSEWMDRGDISKSGQSQSTNALLKKRKDDK